MPGGEPNYPLLDFDKRTGLFYGFGGRGISKMNQRTYSIVTGLIFLVIAFLHLLRLVFGWEAVIAGRPMPAWLSLGGLIIAGYLAYAGLSLGRQYR